MINLDKGSAIFLCFGIACNRLAYRPETFHLPFTKQSVWLPFTFFCRGTVASWLVCSTPDQVGQDQALARDIALCSWVRHFTLTVPLSTQVYKRLLANLMLGVTLQRTSISSRESRNTPSRFMLQKPEQVQALWATWLVCRLYLPYLS